MRNQFDILRFMQEGFADQYASEAVTAHLIRVRELLTERRRAGLTRDERATCDDLLLPPLVGGAAVAVGHAEHGRRRDGLGGVGRIAGAAVGRRNTVAAARFSGAPRMAHHGDARHVA